MQKDAKIQVCFCSKEFMRADRNFPKRPNAFFFTIFHYHHVQEHSGYQLDEQQTKKQELLSETHLRQNRVKNQELVVTTAQAGLSPTCTPSSTTRAGSQGEARKQVWSLGQQKDKAMQLWAPSKCRHPTAGLQTGVGPRLQLKWSPWARGWDPRWG